MATVLIRPHAGRRVPSTRRGVREWALILLELLLAVGPMAAP
jgi:hypothetical protein